MSNVKEFLSGLARKAGVDEKDENLQVILAASALNEIEMPDEVVTQINKGIYTKDAAKNDKDLQDYYYNKIQGNIYSVFDDILEKNINSFPLTDEQKEEIKGQENTTQRQKALLKALSKVKPSKDVDVTKYNEKIDNLNEEIKKLKDEHTGTVEQIKKQSRDNEINFLMKNEIFQAPLIDNDKIPGGKDYLADSIINKVRQKFHLDRDEKGKLLVRDLNDPSLEVFENNEKVDFKKVLSDELHPFIKRSDSGETKKQVTKTSTVADPSKMTLRDMIKAGVA